MRSEGYCSWVCLSVCLLSHISPMERLFVLKTLSRTQRATKVKKFVGFSLKPLRCRDPALPPLYGHAYSRPFFHACTRMRISRVYTRMIHRRGFSTLVLSFILYLYCSVTLTGIRIILRGIGLPNIVGGGNKFSQMPDVTIRNNGAA